MSENKNVLIIAGEVSGDIHAARLVREVKTLYPESEFFGMGGAQMKEAGVDILVDIADMAITGILEVITSLSVIISAFKVLKLALQKLQPKLVILVDYPGFNLRMAKIAKKHGCKVLYYVSPQLWAWHTSRVKIIRKYVDKMAVIFPFEVDFYKKHAIKAVFVGHPLLEEVRPTMDIATAKERFAIPLDAKVIGLFPGSRKGEIARLLPTMIKSAEVLQEKFSAIQFVLPLASSLSVSDLQPYLVRSSARVKIIDGNLYNLIQICDAIIATSGTVTLEISLLTVPMVIVYKFFPPYFPLKLISKIPYIGISNIIAGKQIAKEFLQQQVNLKNIVAEISLILTDKNYNTNMRQEMVKIKELLAKDRAESLAQLVVGMLS